MTQEPTAPSRGHWRAFDRCARFVAATFLLWPLAAYLLLRVGPGPEPIDGLYQLLGLCSLAGLPFLLRLPGPFAAVYYAAVNSIATATLLCLSLTGELVTLDTVLLCLRTGGREAWTFGSAMAGRILCVLAASSLSLQGCRSFLRQPPRPVRAAPATRLALALPLGLLLLGEAGATYPLSLPVFLVQAVRYQAALRPRAEDPFRVTRADRGDELVVFVIGESSVASHWQINGYRRETTPHMARRLAAGELVTLPAHMGTAGLTQFAVPTLLSPFEEIRPPVGSAYRRSVVTVMSRAGFRTAWFTSQDPVAATGEAQELRRSTDATVRRWFDARHDDWLPQAMGRWLDQVPAGPSFLVLHLYASHFPFDERYPPEFARWGGLRPQGDWVHRQDWDVYDNTILYTDHVLETTLRRLEAERRPVLLMYVSDHAETLPDGIWRNQAPRDERLLNVPFVVWANARWRRAHAGSFAAMRAFARAGLASSHVNVVPTLTGLLGIHYEGKPPGRDLLAPDFHPWTSVPALDRDAKTILAAPLPHGALLARDWSPGPGPRRDQGPMPEHAAGADD